MSTIPILFDIDGTLLLTGNAGMLGIERALFQLYGIRETPRVALHGRTDCAIIHELFAALELPLEDYRTFVACYHLHLRQALRDREGYLLPGVRPLLDLLNADDRFALALLTGNSREAAQLKLKHFGIEHFFGWGGFGGWHRDRDDVARMCWDHVQQRCGNRIPVHRAIVIGDTPADIRCARAIGAKVIAVATGNCELPDLRVQQPDLAVSSLQSLTLSEILEIADRQ
jgi:phosphoglycolate phosphatase